MGRIIVRKIWAQVNSRSQRRAKRRQRRMEEEVIDTLRDAAKETGAPWGGLGTAIASLFAKIGLDAEIPDLRGHKVLPASLSTARREPRTNH